MTSSSKLQELKNKMEQQVSNPSPIPSPVRSNFKGSWHYPGRDLESVFEAGPSSSSGQHEGREVSFKGVGTFQVDASDTDRLLRRDRTAEKVPRFSHDAWQNVKLFGVIITAAFLAVFLLWLLFSGDESEKVSPFEGTGFVHPPLNASELQQKQPHNVCPEREWLPEECIGSLREKSKKVYDHCELFFSETGYTQELLKQCGILASTTP